MATYKSPYRKNVSDLFVIGRSTVNEENKKSTFYIRVAGNKARFIVWPNLDSDSGGKIEFVVAFNLAHDFLSLLEYYAKPETPPDHTKIRILRLGKGGYKEGKITDGFIHVGKDEKEVVWFALDKKDRPKIKFRLSSEDWAEFIHKTGESFSEKEYSLILTNAFVNMARGLINSLSSQEFYEEPDKKSNSRNNYYDNNNDNGNNSKKNNNNNGDDDWANDDIPF